MALKMLKWAHRAVNLAACTKGEVVCEDVTACVPGGDILTSCCPDLLPTTLGAVLNIDDGSYGVTGLHVALTYIPGAPSRWWSGSAPCVGGLSQPAGANCLVPVGNGYFVGAYVRCDGSPCGFALGFSVWNQPGGPGTPYAHVFSRGWFVLGDQSSYDCACSPLSLSIAWTSPGVEMTVTG